MLIAYNTEMNSESIKKNIHRLINQTYKLLPSREEGVDWQKPLETIVTEILGMSELLVGGNEIIFSLSCKLCGLLHLNQLELDTDEEFQLYRRTIFECLNLLNQIQTECLD